MVQSTCIHYSSDFVYYPLQLTALIGFISLSVFAKNIEMLLLGQIFCG